jgi:tetratricopeptide (TPR) repeat protein
LTWVVLLGLILLSGLGTRASAEVFLPEFEAANKLYFENKFSEAATNYDKVAQSGQRSAALYFNWGNALFKSGQFGQAIEKYRRAEAISPRDPDVRANLQFARDQTQGPTLAKGKSRRWLERLTLNEWAALAASSFWALFLLLILLQWRPALQRSLRSFVAMLALASIFLCGCAGAALYETRSKPGAIVVVQDATVRNGPLEGSQTGFTVHDGAELQILDQKDNWLQVEADGQRVGWLRKDQVVVTNGS